MKKWTFSVLLAIILSYPALSGAADDHLDTGKDTLFSVPLLKIPIDSAPDSSANAAKAEEEEAQARNAKIIEERQKQDKKVDDAIKKAWGEK